MIDPSYWPVAARVCTAKELEALELRDLHGLGQRVIALSLGLSRSTIRERLDNADRKIQTALKEAA